MLDRTASSVLPPDIHAEPVDDSARPTFAEFFAGGGFARLGLSPRWRCAFANDLCAEKARAYEANFGPGHIAVGDVGLLSAAALPTVDLAWASFPCQDLSLAGGRRGMSRATRSGAFWAFHDLLADLRAARRAPRLVVLENVVGALTSNDGGDFQALVRAMAAVGYRCGALIINAAHFTPQSRPRLFVVAVREDLAIPADLATTDLSDWTSPALERAAMRLASEDLPLIPLAPPTPPARPMTLADVVERDADLYDQPRTAKILNALAPAGRAKLDAARDQARDASATIYGVIAMRTRQTPAGLKRPMAEPRFDGLAGCLRTPGGGSSHQILVVVAPDGAVGMRRFTPRECARLMGAPDAYRLPAGATQAYKLCGDAVAPPVVAYLDHTVLTPILRANA